MGFLDSGMVVVLLITIVLLLVTGLLLFYGQRRSLLLATILASSEDYLWEAIKGSQHEAFIGLIDATIIKTKTNNLV